MSPVGPRAPAHEKTPERLELIFASHAHLRLRVQVEPVLVAAVPVDVVQGAEAGLVERPGDAAKRLVAGTPALVQGGGDEVPFVWCQ